MFADVKYEIQFDDGVINSNNQKVYRVTVAYDAPLHSEVTHLNAKAVGSDGKIAEKPVKYYILEQNNRSADVNEVFQIDETSGIITTKKVRLIQDCC